MLGLPLASLVHVYQILLIVQHFQYFLKHVVRNCWGKKNGPVAHYDLHVD